jgi:2-polyprenyl-3-methyl-5-hydroxy-6-metoxy-1,4-benzoquinol methylase
MAKLHYPKRGVNINYKIGSIKNLLESEKFKLVSEWTEHIILEEEKLI